MELEKSDIFRAFFSLYNYFLTQGNGRFEILHAWFIPAKGSSGDLYRALEFWWVKSHCGLRIQAFSAIRTPEKFFLCSNQTERLWTFIIHITNSILVPRIFWSVKTNLRSSCIVDNYKGWATCCLKMMGSRLHVFQRALSD